MITKQADKPENQVTARADAREPPTMKPQALAWQAQGHCWREAMVRLPAGMLPQDVYDVPAIWKAIQSAPQTRLHRYDRVTCVSHDGTWMIKDAVVIGADNKQVLLAVKPTDRITLPPKLPMEL